MTSGAGVISSASTWSSEQSCERRASLIVAARAAGGRARRARAWCVERSAARADPRVVLDRYCVGCHDSAERAGGLALDRLALDDVHADAETSGSTSCARCARASCRRPASRGPSALRSTRFAAALEQRLDAAARAAPNAGFKGVSRLNRAEYANAVRDLLAYDAGAIVATLPADDAIQGFDNVAAALTVSPTLIESYITAALKISRAAVGDRSQGATQVSLRGSRRLASEPRRRPAARDARRLQAHARLSARCDLRDARPRARPRSARGAALLRRRRAST